MKKKLLAMLFLSFALLFTACNNEQSGATEDSEVAQESSNEENTESNDTTQEEESESSEYTSEDKGTLRVAMANANPWSLVDEKSKDLKGPGVDIIEDLCGRMGYDVEFVVSDNISENFNKQHERKAKVKEKFPYDTSLEKYVYSYVSKYNNKFSSRIHRGFGLAQYELRKILDEIEQIRQSKSFLSPIGDEVKIPIALSN